MVDWRETSSGLVPPVDAGADVDELHELAEEEWKLSMPSRGTWISSILESAGSSCNGRSRRKQKPQEALPVLAWAADTLPVDVQIVEVVADVLVDTLKRLMTRRAKAEQHVLETGTWVHLRLKFEGQGQLATGKWDRLLEEKSPAVGTIDAFVPFYVRDADAVVDLQLNKVVAA